MKVPLRHLLRKCLPDTILILSRYPGGTELSPSPLLSNSYRVYLQAYWKNLTLGLFSPHEVSGLDVPAFLSIYEAIQLYELPSGNLAAYQRGMAPLIIPKLALLNPLSQNHSCSITSHEDFLNILKVKHLFSTPFEIMGINFDDAEPLVRPFPSIELYPLDSDPENGVLLI